MRPIIAIILAASFVISCEHLDPRPIEDLTEEDIWSHAIYGEGILATVYLNLNTDYEIELDYYTDNAVPSEPGTNRLALGGWTVENNSIGDWDQYYTNIAYLNLFLENAPDLTYNVTDATKDSLLNIYRIGEAYYLRAWFEWQLLQHYGGYAEGGSEALGFPIVTETLELTDELDLPRNSYEECVQQIVSDCDSALSILPLDYNTPRDPYTGVANRGRGSGLAALALKARVYLYAASPAFGAGDQAKWERAATAAATAIDALGGLADLDPYGNFNTPLSFDNIWISPFSSHNIWEQELYPPSLFGSGNINPSQNLVDAFPASDGFPIALSSVYNPSEPYLNRDARFNRFIFFNGDNYNGTVVNTAQGGADAPGGLSKLGTRTGYYQKKLTSAKVFLDPGASVTDYKFRIYLSKAELYLNFAEAANEAYGPSDSRFGYTATDVMARIRQRALGAIQDDYMNQQAASGKDAFREFIRNERRVELCFEGDRFWDMRRWDLELDHAVEGVVITSSGGSFSYEYRTVENHVFEDYMRYIPVPYDQTLIMDNLEQNAGWD